MLLHVLVIHFVLVQARANPPSSGELKPCTKQEKRFWLSTGKNSNPCPSQSPKENSLIKRLLLKVYRENNKGQGTPQG